MVSYFPKAYNLFLYVRTLRIRQSRRWNVTFTLYCPEDFLRLSAELTGYGYREINLNVGCPSGTVVTRGKGAGFLKDNEKILELFRKELSAETKRSEHSSGDRCVHRGNCLKLFLFYDLMNHRH